MWLLRDPLQLSEQQLIFPVALAQLLPLLDGTHDVDSLHRAFSQLVGEAVAREVVVTTIQQLDAAYLLENERSAAVQAQKLAQYHKMPFRPATLAGVGYPETADDVIALFAGYEAEAGEVEGQKWEGRAIVSPHIDYQRGGPVYAAVWSQTHAALADADLVLIFGTDHSGGAGSITLTTLPYATPFGVLPTAPDMVQRLATAVGPDAAFSLELNHRHEHSVELSAVWLHYIYDQLGRKPAPMVPILTGSFHHFVTNGHHPRRDEPLNNLIETLRAETAGMRVVTVASVDLAHVGPTFGDSFVMDRERREKLQASDEQLIAAIKRGDCDTFYDNIARIQDRNRICGFSSLYLMLRYLDGAEGRVVAYDQCPADEQDNSLVSICGLLLE